MVGGSGGSSSRRVAADVAAEADIFEVAKILDEKLENGKTLYKVRWKGYSATYDTWEPAKNLGGCEASISKWNKAQLAAKNKRKKRTATSAATSSTNNVKKQKKSPTPFDSVLDDSSKGLTVAELAAGLDGPTMTVEASTKAPPKPPKQQKKPSFHYDPLPTKKEVLEHPDFKAFQKKLKALKGPLVTLVNEVSLDASPPLDFEFIDKLRLTSDVPEYDFAFTCGCSCPPTGCEDPEDCQCLEDSHQNPAKRQFAYTTSGRLRASRDNRLAILECNDMCECGPDCKNRVVQKGRTVTLEIFRTEMKGWGLRCPEPLKKGTYIDVYLGEVIGPKEATWRASEGDQLGLSYLFDLDKFTMEEDSEEESEDELAQGMGGNNGDCFTIDGRNCGSVLRFVNHSCEPNLQTFAVASDRRDGHVYDLAMFTSRDIAPYEELTFSYVAHNNSIDTAQGGKAWECYCGAESCKKKLWS